MATSTTSHARSLWASAVVIAVVVILGLLGWLYVRGGGPLPTGFGSLRPAETEPLAASAPAEQVLRTLRLIGVDRAVAAESGGTALVRIELPVADSSADVTAAWEAGLAALREAYPSAGDYTVQVFGPGAVPLVEMTWSGEEARGTEDAARLRERAKITLLSETDGS